MIHLEGLAGSGEYYYEQIVLPSSAPRAGIFKLAPDKFNFEIDLFGKNVTNGYHSALMYSSEMRKHVDAVGSIKNYCGSAAAAFLYWDIDNKDLEESQKDAKAIIERLESSGADMNSVQCFFSGKKGFHIIYRTDDVLKLGFRKDIHHIVKKVCMAFAEGLSSVDPVIYDKTRIIRAQNSKHADTKLYKILLESIDISIADILEQAATQVEGNDVMADSGNSYVTDIIEDYLESYSENKPDFTRKVSSDFLLNGIANGFGEGDRNTGLTSYAGMLRRRNFDEGFISASLAANNLLSSSPLPQKDLDRIVSSVMKYRPDEKYIEEEKANSGDFVRMGECVKSYQVMRKKSMNIETTLTHLNPILRIFDPTQTMVIGARPGCGKAVSNSTVIPMPNRQHATAKDIRVGDRIFGSDGKPTTVTGVFPQGIRKLYRFSFSSGRTVDADINHRWLVRKRYDYDEEVMTTGELITYIAKADCKKDKRHPTIRYCDPVQYDTSNELPVDPWLLGALIGDGYINHDFTFSNIEQDVLEKVSSKVNGGLQFISRSTYRINDIELRNKLRAMGLWGNTSESKFIPNEYLTASVSERTALLQGLIDTDGSTTKNVHDVEYSTASKKLCLNIKMLVESLGGRATFTVRSTSFTYKGEKRKGLPSYRLIIGMPTEIVPVSSEKHLAKYLVTRKYARDVIEKIEYSHDDYATCFSVDNDDHLFLCGDFVVTHNTLLAMKIGNEVGKFLDKYALMLSFEMNRSQVGFRAAQIEMSTYDEELNNDEVVHHIMNDDDFIDKIDKKWTNFITFDKTVHSIDSVIAIVNRANEELDKEVGMVIMDYVQLMPTTGNQQEMDLIGHGLNRVSNETFTRTVALSQINRGGGDEYSKPRMFQLKGMGSLEDVADIALMMWKDKAEKGRIHVEAEKYRGGEVGYKFDLLQRGMLYKTVDFYEAENVPQRYELGR